MPAEVASWMLTGERQTARIRVLYLKAMLKQDVGYFDVDARTGEVVTSISSDTLLIQDAISEKVLIYVHNVDVFVRIDHLCDSGTCRWDNSFTIFPPSSLDLL